MLIDGTQSLANYIISVQAANAALTSRVDTEHAAWVAGDATNASAITSVLAKTAAQQNLIANSTFEYGLSGWSHGVVGAGKDSVHGAYAYVGATASDAIYREVQGISPGVYVLSGEIYANSTTGTKRLSITALDAGGAAFGGDTVVAGPPSGWELVSVVIAAPAGTAQIRVAFICEGTDTNSSVRKLKLEPGTVPTTWNDGATTAQSASVTSALQAGVT
ncbi:MAG: hypothetical protein ACTS5I_11385, partial [Rhodanobacter sp.]